MFDDPNFFLSALSIPGARILLEGLLEFGGKVLNACVYRKVTDSYTPLCVRPATSSFLEEKRDVA